MYLPSDPTDSIQENHNNNPYLQKKLEAPMPWIGMYVALASISCSLAMAADIIHGVFRIKKVWFPCKFFSLNATSLTLLAVAVKLPLDLTTNMWATTDRLAKISSISLMTTAMANFMPSLGSMGDREILINVTALGILITTVIVDICIQIAATEHFLHGRVLLVEEISSMFFMMILLVLLTSSAVMVLDTKRYLEAKYQEIHNVALNQEIPDIGNMVDLVKKYWLMAEISFPQFVIARSVTCGAAGFVCVLNALVLAEAQIRMVVVHKRFDMTAASSYGFSTRWILLAQSVGVIAGTVAPASRWCTSMSLMCSSKEKRGLKEKFKVEAYWTQKLKDWKGCSINPRIRHRTCRKFLHSAKQLTLNLLVRVQVSVVLCSKVLHVISRSVKSKIVVVFKFTKCLKLEDSIPRHLHRETESVHAMIRKLSLEGEAELSGKTLKSIREDVDGVIAAGKRQKLENLLKLLQTSHCNFIGVAEFDSSRVKSLHQFGEPPNIWSLTVVTLTSIAIALPKIERIRVNELLSSVREGLYCVKFIEKCLYENDALMNVRKAADIWEEVELFHRWQKMDLFQISLESENHKKVLQVLSNEGKEIVLKFQREAKTCLMKNPLHWEAKVIAANSMYRICQTILLGMEGEVGQTEEELFGKLSVMIADVLAACLTNLTRVITLKCHRNGIEERVKSVREAALVLGQADDILEFLWRHQATGLDEDQAARIEAWRRLLMQENETASDSTTSLSSEMESPECGGDHVVINVILAGTVIPEPGGPEQPVPFHLDGVERRDNGVV